MRKGRWARAQQWLHAHPWAATGFLLGIGIGVLLSLPLLPYELPNSSAQLIGSFLGAAIAVTGALWVTTNKERRFRTDLKLAAMIVYEPFITSLADSVALIIPLDGQALPLEPTELEALRHGKNLSVVTRASFEDLKPAFGSTPNDIIIYRHLLGAMDRFIGYFDAEIAREATRRQRQDQERQAAFNHPETPKVTAQPVDAQVLVHALNNSRTVMDTVGR